MSYCYILYSERLRKYYVGATSESVEKRIEMHNGKGYGSHYTAQTNDWEIFLVIEVLDMSHAIRLERKIKSMKSSKYIANLKLYPELIQKIIIETSI